MAENGHWLVELERRRQTFSSGLSQQIEAVDRSRDSALSRERARERSSFRCSGGERRLTRGALSCVLISGSLPSGSSLVATRSGLGRSHDGQLTSVHG